MFCVSFTDMSREVKKKTPDKLHELALLLVRWLYNVRSHARKNNVHS